MVRNVNEITWEMTVTERNYAMREKSGRPSFFTYCVADKLHHHSLQSTEFRFSSWNEYF